MKYLRYYLYCSILCAGVLSCTSNSSTKGLYFPITVFAGVADLTVATGGEMAPDSNDKTGTFVRRARMGNHFLEKLRPNMIIFQQFVYSRGSIMRKRIISKKMTKQLLLRYGCKKANHLLCRYRRTRKLLLLLKIRTVTS